MDIFTVTRVTSKISVRKSVKPQKCLFVVEFEQRDSLKGLHACLECFKKIAVIEIPCNFTEEWSLRLSLRYYACFIS